MTLMTRPEVKTVPGGRFWEATYQNFYLKAYVPDNEIEGQVNNYGFRAPFLLVFEEERMTMDDAVAFANDKGFARIAAAVDTSVLFVYPTCEDGWAGATEDLYIELIGETSGNPEYADGIASLTDFFTKEFKGYFIRGAIFRADIYSYGKSANYVAKHLLKTINGKYLWGPGEITPAMCSMEGLSVVPDVQRKDIAVLSVGNSEEINAAFDGCENLLIKDAADVEADFKNFVRKFKMWCGKIDIEPDFEALNMTEESGIVEVKTSPDNRSRYKDQPTHKVGYFAYYNNHIMDDGPVPLVMGFHGGGDTSMYLTFVAGWYEICHKYGFLFVSLDDHLSVTATEIMEVIEAVKKRYRVDDKRIYATGFSMGSGKTWDLYQEYPDAFAGFMPCSALFPMKENRFGLSLGDPRLNMTVRKPVFYSGGECSHLPELPGQADSCLDRLKYVAGVNKLKDDFDALDFADRENWDDRFYGIKGDRVEVFHDDSRDCDLTVRYYDSTDGVCCTAFASVSGQIHECREHSCECAWKYISGFVNET